MPALMIQISKLKQCVATLAVRLIEFLVNSRWLVPILGSLSKRIYKSASLREVPKKKASSLFSGLSLAFIADGNRRYYKKYGKTDSRVSDMLDDPRTAPGLEVIKDIVYFCYINKVSEVSFFCFSTKNFNRSSEEVESIMSVLRKERSVNFDVDCKVNVYGRLELVDKQARDSLLEAVRRTRHKKGLVVNIFFAYSSTDAEAYGYVYDKPVDLIIRTGNTRRLSDFMVLQASRGSAIDFVKPLWPELSLLHFWLILLKYRIEEKYIN